MHVIELRQRRNCSELSTRTRKQLRGWQRPHVSLRTFNKMAQAQLMAPSKYRREYGMISVATMNPPPTLSCADEFRALAGLVALVAAMNTNSMQPTLAHVAGEDIYGRLRHSSKLPETRSATRRALNAMASLLVRNAEVVACTIPGVSDTEANILAVEDSQPPVTPYFPLASVENQNVAKAQATSPKSDQSGPHVDFAALANRREDDNTFLAGSKEPVYIKPWPPSESLWKTLCSNRWAVLEK